MLAVREQRFRCEREGRTLSQMLAGPIRGIGLAHWQGNCAFYVGWANDFQVTNWPHFRSAKTTVNIWCVVEPLSLGHLDVDWPMGLLSPDALVRAPVRGLDSTTGSARPTIEAFALLIVRPSAAEPYIPSIARPIHRALVCG